MMPGIAWLVVAAVLVLLYGVFNRSRSRRLDGIPPLHGETILLDCDVQLSAMPRRPAAFTSLVFVQARVRVTSARVLVAQPVLFAPKTLVVRFVGHLHASDAASITAWKDGCATFVIDRAKSGVVERAGVRELQLFADADAPFLPTFVALRGTHIDEVAAHSGLRASPG
jgi:hypothetical protein